MYLFSKKPDEAINILKKALGFESDNITLLFSLAGAYEKTKDYVNATVNYQRIVDLGIKKPSDKQIYVAAINNLANMLAIKGDKDSLNKAFDLAKNFEKTRIPAFMDTLGWIYIQMGENDKAIEILKKVVDLSDKTPIFQYHLGMAYYKNGDNQLARTHLNLALASNKDFPGKDQAEDTLKKIK